MPVLCCCKSFKCLTGVSAKQKEARGGAWEVDASLVGLLIGLIAASAEWSLGYPIEAMDLVWSWNGLGMELLWMWYGLGMELLWTWYGLGMELLWTWYGLGMDLV